MLIKLPYWRKTTYNGRVWILWVLFLLYAHTNPIVATHFAGHIQPSYLSAKSGSLESEPYLGSGITARIMATITPLMLNNIIV